MASISQINANQINSLNSTGPKTPDGKKRSSLNAMRHGFTGQVVVLPESEAPLYKTLCANYHHDFAPKGQLECDYVQELADIRWALNRIRAHETNLLSLESISQELPVDTGDEQINSSLAVAGSLRQNSKTLANLSIYEHRKLRAFERTLAKLEQLQAGRKQNEEYDLRQAARFRQVFEKTESNWHPGNDGFVCSASELDGYIRSEARKNHVIDKLYERKKKA